MIDVILTKFFPLRYKMAERFENLDNILRDWVKEKITEADKGQSQNIYEIRKNVLKIRKNISNRNVFWKSWLKSLSNLKNYNYKS